MNLFFDKEHPANPDGVHAGETYVELHGYLTEQQIAVLKAVIESG